MMTVTPHDLKHAVPVFPDPTRITRLARDRRNAPDEEAIPNELGHGFHPPFHPITAVSDGRNLAVEEWSVWKDRLAVWSPITSVEETVPVE